MKKLIYIAFVSQMGMFPNAKAQSAMDAFRYSFTTSTGTARSSAIGGAFGAVGADPGATTINPGSAGLYRKTEFSFSPAVHFSEEDARYENSRANDSRLAMNVNNWGLSIHKKMGKDDNLPEWKGITAGFTFNRLANFNRRAFISGEVTGNSLMREFVRRANGSNPSSLSEFSERMAFDSYLIDTFSVLGPNQYIPNLLKTSPVSQRTTIQSIGSLNENNFFLSGNFANKLFVGASLGLFRVRFNETSLHSEKVNDTIPIQAFTFEQRVASTGAGFFAKAGLVYMPVEYVRIGASYQTGSRIAMSDIYNTSLTTQFTTGSYSFASPEGAYNYIVRIPSKSTFSLCLLHPRVGLLSADVELSDFSGMRIFPNADFSQINSQISEQYGMQQTYRTGMELRLGNFFNLRGGYAFNRSPVLSDVDNFRYTRITGGLGYRKKNVFCDLALVQTRLTFLHYTYDSSLVNAAGMTQNTTLLVFTGGIRF